MLYIRIVVIGLGVFLLAACGGGDDTGGVVTAPAMPDPASTGGNGGGIAVPADPGSGPGDDTGPGAARRAFTLTIPSEASIRQGGIITLPVTVEGDGFGNGTLNLSAPAKLSVSSTARLATGGNGAGMVGYSFDSVSMRGANLTLYVGSEVPVGVYRLTITGSASGASESASVELEIEPQGDIVEIWPTGYGTYQSNVKSLGPGDVLVLHEGTYPDYAFLRVSGTADQPITIRGYGHGEAKPVLEYTGSGKNHWEIRGSHLIVKGLEFDSPHTYSIRIRPSASGEVDDVTLIDNTFVGCGGGCVSANDAGATYRNIRMIDNLMLHARRTPVYIGNHQGTAAFHNFLFEGNVIDGRSIIEKDVVGYGIEVKLNVENAVLRNNYIVGARGPGIMTYGLESGKASAYRTIVEGNIVIGSCTDRNILVGAGPAIVRRNLSMGGHNDGYGVQDYGRWHLLSGIRLLENTALLNKPSGFWFTSPVSGTGLENLRLVHNLAYPAPDGAGFSHLPADNGTNVIEYNDTAAPTAAMATMVGRLRGLIPAPRDLKPIWPLLSQGPLNAAQLTNLLDHLVSLPNQSGSSDPRECS